jgi:hypothetical protein
MPPCNFHLPLHAQGEKFNGVGPYIFRHSQTLAKNIVLIRRRWNIYVPIMICYLFMCFNFIYANFSRKLTPPVPEIPDRPIATDATTTTTSWILPTFQTNQTSNLVNISEFQMPAATGIQPIRIAPPPPNQKKVEINRLHTDNNLNIWNEARIP